MSRGPGYDREAFIRAVRAALGERSQNRVAAEMGASQGYVSQWLLGRVPAREYLVRLAQVTGTDPNALLVPAGYPPVGQGSASDWFLAGARALSREMGRPLMLTSEDMPEPDETREQVEERLAGLRRRMDGSEAGSGRGVEVG
jgi:transcriptional regulator with XRE-family HTH domain